MDTFKFATAPTMDQIMEIFDGVHNRVEGLRREAMRIEQERNTIIADITTLCSQLEPFENTLSEVDRADAVSYIQLINTRCKNIMINVVTPRDESQEAAFQQIQQFMNDFCELQQNDRKAARTICLIYMNSTTSETSGTVDKKFESALLGCTADDQRNVKYFLQNSLQHLN